MLPRAAIWWEVTLMLFLQTSIRFYQLLLMLSSIIKDAWQPVFVWHEFSGNANILECYPPTFVVKEPLHLHGRPRVSDAEHGAGNDALLSRGTVRGPHQAPVGLVVEPLQDLHSLTSAHRQLTTAAITGYEVVDHHCQFTATGELQGEQEKSEMRSFYGNAWKPLHLHKQKSSWVALTFQKHHQKGQEGLCGAIFKKWLKIPGSY